MKMVVKNVRRSWGWSPSPVRYPSPAASPYSSSSSTMVNKTFITFVRLQSRRRASTKKSGFLPSQQTVRLWVLANLAKLSETQFWSREHFWIVTPGRWLTSCWIDVTRFLYRNRLVLPGVLFHIRCPLALIDYLTWCLPKDTFFDQSHKLKLQDNHCVLSHVEHHRLVDTPLKSGMFRWFVRNNHKYWSDS